MALTPRGKSLRWLTRHRNLKERPPGSNTDDRKDGIRKAQIDCANGGRWLIGQPWCGVWVFNALQAAGVKGLNSRLASVALIEQDARAKRAPFGRGWTTNHAEPLRGDAVVLFGHGHHVGTVREINLKKHYIVTDEGNTSGQGMTGSQSDGGQSARRVRPLRDVHGYALVNYPGS